MTRELPAFLRDLINSPPRAGEGVHDWLFRVARNLHAHLSVVEIESLLESKVRACGRNVPRVEIRQAIQNSIPFAWRPSGEHKSPSLGQQRWPEVNKVEREVIIAKSGGLADLWELSPIRIEDGESHSEEIM